MLMFTPVSEGDDHQLSVNANGVLELPDRISGGGSRRILSPERVNAVRTGHSRAAVKLKLINFP
jgi:hypothetical protein